MKRYVMTHDENGGVITEEHPRGDIVHYADHEADKAQVVAAAVETETSEMRAELVSLITAMFRRSDAVYSDGWYTTIRGTPADQMASRLVELDAWETKAVNSRYIPYRPIESRSSGGSDDD